MAKPPCPKAYLGGRPPGPAGRLASAPGWKISTAHLAPRRPRARGGATGRGGAGGGLTVVPIYTPPYPSPSFFSCWAGWNSPPHSLLLSRGRGRGKAFTVVPIYGPPPHPLPGGPACVLITQVLSSRTQAGHSAMPGKIWRGEGGGHRSPPCKFDLPPPPSPFAGRAETAASQGCIRRKRISHCSNQFKTKTPYP